MKLQNTKHNITKDSFLLKMDGLDENHYKWLYGKPEGFILSETVLLFGI